MTRPWPELTAEMDARDAWRKAHPVRDLPGRIRRETRWRWQKVKAPPPWKRVQWRWQRSRRGWSGRDNCSADDYLAELIGGLIADLRTHLHSYPGDGYPGGETFGEWQQTLDRISGPLLAYQSHWDCDGDDVHAWIAREKEVLEAAQAALHLLADHFPHLWD
jgi:hypothetical protein